MEETLAEIKLNSFQRLMLCWSQLSAYNAVHILHISGKPDKLRLEQSTFQILTEMGLGQPRFKQKNAYFIPLSQFILLTPTTRLDQHINHELNRKFAPEDFPFRFFMIAEESSYYFGVSYNHWIADAYSIQLLLQRIVSCYRADSPSPPALTLIGHEFEKVFRKHLGWIPGILWLSEMLRSLKLFYRAHRLSLSDPLNFHSRHVMQNLPAQALTHLKSYCKKQNSTLNDVLIAVLAQVMGRFSVHSRYRKKSYRLFGKRDRVAISTIANIRSAASESLDHMLAQCLGSYTVVLNAPEEKTMEDLTQEISRSTAKIKKSSRIVRSHYNFETVLKLWNWNSSPKRRAIIFHKYSPICAGISNVNVKAEWLLKNETSENVLDYWRVSPAGPLSPIVFSITTFKDRIAICLVYRSVVIDDEKAIALCDTFCQELAKLF